MTATLSRAKPETRTTKAEWLVVALDLLVEQGIDNVKVLTITKALGASRSSFYWFFKNRDALLDELLELWRRKNTRSIVERARRPASTITEAALNVFECWINPELFDSRLDSAIRDWARQEPVVHATMRDADTVRVAAIRDMFVRFAYSPNDAAARARVLYYSQVGYFALDTQDDIEARLSQLAHTLRCFTGRDVSADELSRFADYSRRVGPQ